MYECKVTFWCYKEKGFDRISLKGKLYEKVREKIKPLLCLWN